VAEWSKAPDWELRPKVVSSVLGCGSNFQPWITKKAPSQGNKWYSAVIIDGGTLIKALIVR